MQPEYSRQLEMAFNYTEPSKWCEMFNNWEFMELRQDLRLTADFHLLSLANWTKLKTAFGGAPEIPFFSYQADVERTREDGTKETVKESMHDFHPIRVCCHVMKRTGERNDQSVTLLVSKHLTHN